MQITQERFTAGNADRDLLHLMEAERALENLTALVEDLRITNGKYTGHATWAYLEFLEAAALAFQFDTDEHTAAILPELNINDEGYVLDRDGEPTLLRMHAPLTAFRAGDVA